MTLVNFGNFCMEGKEKQANAGESGAVYFDIEAVNGTVNVGQ